MPENASKIEETLISMYNGLDLDLRLEHLREEITHSTLFDYIFKVKSGTDLIGNTEFLKLLQINR